ncbi:hypothetical protein [Muricoccus pecuniae]|uniref:Uncharacterized protein n=1 Tax=Muricoccus pecuniae TaxID=693023 RepID=A0A840Y319_9PROT|nr:hypothetical protein [Roseomonas pecuniae]MBB5695508.1 hypothetical protein [Roseomonas pecuniae]
MFSPHIQQLLNATAEAVNDVEMQAASAGTHTQTEAASRSLAKLGPMSMTFTAIDAGFLLKAQQVAQQVALLKTASEVAIARPPSTLKN